MAGPMKVMPSRRKHSETHGDMNRRDHQDGNQNGPRWHDQADRADRRARQRRRKEPQASPRGGFGIPQHFQHHGAEPDPRGVAKQNRKDDTAYSVWRSSAWCLARKSASLRQVDPGFPSGSIGATVGTNNPMPFSCSVQCQPQAAKKPCAAGLVFSTHAPHRVSIGRGIVQMITDKDARPIPVFLSAGFTAMSVMTCVGWELVAKQMPTTATMLDAAHRQ